MPDVTSRLRAALIALLLGLLAVGLMPLSATVAEDPSGLDRFLEALGAVESNGRYDAVNGSSGARGKYQIMPSNWPSWAGRYLGDPDAAWTPANQDAVARGKVADLYRWLDDWGVVAHWWLTGSDERDPDLWSDFSRGYVNKILAATDLPLLPPQRPSGGPPATPGTATPTPAPPSANLTVVDESNLAIDFSGGWGEAAHARYNDGLVRYAELAGATAWFTFSGSSIAWIGPTGPTRGAAAIYLDEELVETVDLFSPRYRPRATLFETTFDRSGTHTITIEVVGTPDRETVAIDEFVVGN